MKIVGVGKRFFKTKINTLVSRSLIRMKYPYEFLNKMSENEVNIFLNEIRNILKQENIKSININYYNKVVKSLIEEREYLYQLFKLDS
jgi:beta-glucosidase/6-phospho-beta-glucosidase/beta-galactosidase